MLNITEGSQRPSERVIIYAIASTFLWSIVGGGAAADDEENVEMIISPARAIAICEKINKHNESGVAAFHFALPVDELRESGARRRLACRK